MKILFLDQFSDPGGAQLQLFELLPAIVERGWRATVAMPGDGEMLARVRETGCGTAPITCGPYRSGAKSATDLARFAIDTPRLAAEIRDLARNVDLVYVNGPRLLPALAMAHVDAPVLFHSHSLVPAGAMRTVAGNAVRRTNAQVIAACEFVASPWRAFVDNVRVVYNGVPGPAAPLWRGDTRVIGCIGRIDPAKGQLEFLRVARRIAEAHPSSRFVIHGAPLFGAPPHYETQLRDEARGLPVEFAGWSRDIHAALAAIDLLLVPSIAPEATTRVILEAYAAGVPVIAFPSGGIPEVVDPAWLANGEEEMARLAIAALSSPESMAEASRAARAAWEARFQQRRYREEILSAIAATIETRTAV